MVESDFLQENCHESLENITQCHSTLKHGRSSDRFYLYRSSNVYCHTYILGIWILFSVSLFWKTEYKTEPK